MENEKTKELKITKTNKTKRSYMSKIYYFWTKANKILLMYFTDKVKKILWMNKNYIQKNNLKGYTTCF